MNNRDSIPYRIFTYFNYLLLSFVALSCILPVLHMLALSLSQNHYAESNLVSFWPKGFTSNAYAYIFSNQQFLRSAFTAVKRAFAGTALNIVLTVLLAYPMSRSSKQFKGRNIYMALIVFSMVFSGGLIPTYMLVKSLGIFDSLWALILPTAVPTFSVVLMMNFFRQLPKEIEEAAFVDGASYFRCLVQIVLPISTAVLSTVGLFAFVGHWNSWFDGQIFNNKIQNYPLQSYLQVLIARKVPMGIDDSIIKRGVGQRTLTSAQIFIAMFPLLVLYPFLQRYFASGVVIGSVKG